MRNLEYVTKLIVVGTIAGLAFTSFAAAQHNYWTMNTQPATERAPEAQKFRKSRAAAETSRRSAFARMHNPVAPKKEHHLVLQVNTNDPAAMNLTLNNAANVTEYYRGIGEKVKIEVVTFGPGLHMLRDDTSPVKARIEEMALSSPEVSFKACANTQERMQKAENKSIPIIKGADVVKSGVVRVMELQEKGWAYVKP
ncbi:MULTISPECIES: DsrE family protein [Bradyrhizobium]|uniref:DsrE family protein n=1 Tax=Bradyrhizobium TaxID=374 RepID=UPI0004047061|nr:MULTISPECIES: DsrE family protein [Bradyrhizobium]UFW52805.1 DsrE family protein [Bradyrhizobium arachidis]